jgi:hypothetical protein
MPLSLVTWVVLAKLLEVDHCLTFGQIREEVEAVSKKLGRKLPLHADVHIATTILEASQLLLVERAVAGSIMELDPQDEIRLTNAGRQL